MYVVVKPVKMSIIADFFIMFLSCVSIFFSTLQQAKHITNKHHRHRNISPPQSVRTEYLHAVVYFWILLPFRIFNDPLMISITNNRSSSSTVKARAFKEIVIKSNKFMCAPFKLWERAKEATIWYVCI